MLLGRIEDQLAPGVPRALPNSAQLEQLETQALLIPSRLALVPDRSFVANREGSNEPTVDESRPSEKVDRRIAEEILHLDELCSQPEEHWRAFVHEPPPDRIWQRQSHHERPAVDRWRNEHMVFAKLVVVDGPDP